MSTIILAVRINFIKLDVEENVLTILVSILVLGRLPMDKPKIIVTWVRLNHSEPIQAGGAAFGASQRFNMELLDQHSWAMSQIQEYLRQAKKYLANATGSLDLEEARGFLTLALKLFDLLPKKLLIHRTHRKHHRHTSTLRVEEALPTMNEYGLIEHIKIQRNMTVKNLVETLLGLIALNIKSERWYSTDNYFAEIDTLGCSHSYISQINKLKQQVTKGKRCLCKQGTINNLKTFCA